MLVRVRLPTGKVVRVSVEPHDSLSHVYHSLCQTASEEDRASLSAQCVWQREAEAHLNDHFSLAALGIQHGDLLTLKGAAAASAVKPTDAPPAPSASSSAAPFASTALPLARVDELLLASDGKIHRPLDSQYCRHGDHGMCDYCRPLEPFDPRFYSSNHDAERAEPDPASPTTFKYKSFHTYLRQLAIQKAGSTRPYLERAPLIEEPRYTVDLSCKNHAPYPKGKCSACQVSPITLKAQEYRMVDHIEFEDASGGLVDAFVSEWRQSGYQAFAYLLGRYEPIENNRRASPAEAATMQTPPLGIKAVVQALYSPLQDGSLDGFELLTDEHPLGEPLEHLVNTSLSYFDGLQIVGQIYTDLRPNTGENASSDSTVAYLRNKESFFVSCYECAFMARQQARLPYLCPWKKKASSFGTQEYDSRFVTVIVTGDSENHVSLTGYQLSRLGERLFSHEYISPSTDPRQVYVLKNAPSEIFYQGSDHSLKKAEPTFPVDYLLVSLSVGFRKQALGKATPLFMQHAFPITRTLLLSDGVATAPAFLTKLHDYLAPILRALTSGDVDGELLIKLSTDFNFFMALVALSRELLVDKSAAQPSAELQAFVQLIREKDPNGLMMFYQSSELFQTLLQLLPDSGDASTASGNAGQAPTSLWQCHFCTFQNRSPQGQERVCEICGLPNQ